jgi:hypothetical protein
MIALPREDDLLKHIRASLDAVGKANLSNTRDWFPRIASELAKRVSTIGLTCFAREKPEPCKGTEILWDFSAFIDDDDGTKEDERHWAQAAIVGEVEWSVDEGEIDKDFAKLLSVDSLSCFMTFQKRSIQEAKVKLDQLQTAVRRRQKYARLRGLTRPPAFLLSCWVLIDRRFEHLPVFPA